MVFFHCNESSPTLKNLLDSPSKPHDLEQLVVIKNPISWKKKNSFKFLESSNMTSQQMITYSLVGLNKLYSLVSSLYPINMHLTHLKFNLVFPFVHEQKKHDLKRHK
jgi:hypothetical protein